MKPTSQVFQFTVHRLHWLSRVPGLAHLFDALLVAWTFLAHRSRLKAMEQLEAGALQLPGVELRVHRFGGIEFVQEKHRELGHLHGHGLLDVRLTLEQAKQLVATRQVSSHHIFPHSRWISYQLENTDDVPFALKLLATAHAGKPTDTD